MGHQLKVGDFVQHLHKPGVLSGQITRIYGNYAEILVITHGDVERVYRDEHGIRQLVVRYYENSHAQTTTCSIATLEIWDSGEKERGTENREEL